MLQGLFRDTFRGRYWEATGWCTTGSDHLGHVLTSPEVTPPVTLPGPTPDDDLPPVDVVAPDDARELDADVLAYYREERERARDQRRNRLGRLGRSGWRRYGWGPPAVVAALLALTVTATVLWLTPQRTVRPPAAPLAGQPTAPPGDVGGLLPDARVLAPGGERPLRDLRPAVLALVTPQCRCAATLRSIHQQASEFALPLYLVTGTEDAPALRRFATESGLGAVPTAVDRDDALVPEYTDGEPTYVLVHADGVVREILTDVEPSDRLELQLAPLADPGLRG